MRLSHTRRINFKEDRSVTETGIKRLGLILAIQAEIEGMKASNDQRMITHESLAYTEDHFQSRAEELRNIVAMHEDQF